MVDHRGSDTRSSAASVAILIPRNGLAGRDHELVGVVALLHGLRLWLSQPHISIIALLIGFGGLVACIVAHVVAEQFALLQK